MLELLAPAGSPEAVIAAVQNGADAIYLGLEGTLNARRGAKNFSREEFLQALKYCRERDCRVYVAMNTLVSDREMEAAVETGRFLSDVGADAVLVQDPGLAWALHTACPDLPLHASTQMSIHNLAGAHAAAQLGLERVVLARELDREQIRFIAAHSPIAVEVFVHGALCFCHSGQCYLSALIGRRSGNRGMCAQPCRLRYSMGRRLDDYPLSLKDNALCTWLDQLRDMGVASVKIEGRMKRPEYTAIVTGIYHRALREGIQPSPQDWARMAEAFSRDGFTDGYYTGERENMHGVRGEPDADLKALYAEARRSYNSGERRRVPVDFQLTARRRGVTLTATDDSGHSAMAYGPPPQLAVHPGSALTEASAAAQLYKTGGTQYHCRKVGGVIEEGLFLPTSALNALRRDALAELDRKRDLPPQRRSLPAPVLGRSRSAEGRMQLHIQVLNPEQLTQALAETEPDRLYVPLKLAAERPELLEPFMAHGAGVAAVLPRVITDDGAETVLELLRRVKGLGIQEALVGNLGHIALARGAGFTVRGDFGLNVFNSHTLHVLAQAGLESATASFELRLAQIRDLSKCMDTESILYGRLPCMVTDQDILTRAGLLETGTLSDRMGSMFPVVREFGGRNVILNAHKLFLADKLEEVAACGLWAGRLLFTTESPRECVQVARRYQGQNDYAPNGLTRGLYYRGVE